MAERTRSVGDWLRGLLGGREKPASPDETQALPGAHAVEACERLVADAICRTWGPDAPEDEPEGTTVNAFDSALTSREFEDASAALSAARGMAMSGLRTAVFLSTDQLARCGAQLRSAVDQHLPLVLQVTAGPDPGAGIDAAIASGAFVLVARDAQQACDLTLAAHRAAERSLTPGVVVLDGAEAAWTVAQVALPDAARVRDLVGEPGAEIECPTRAQSLLFGERRRRVPRWFDLDEPLSSGVRTSGGEAAAAAAARDSLFASHVAPISAEALEAVATATARPLPAVSGHGLGDARRVVVAHGSVLPVAEAVSVRLGREGGVRRGVLGLLRLSPFPGEEVREALTRAETVTLLERRHASSAAAPLLASVRGALAGTGARLLRATFTKPVASDLAALYANMDAGAGAREEVRLGLSQLEDAPDHPRRQAWIQRTRRDCPDLAQATLESVDPIDLRPPGSHTLLMRLGASGPPARQVEALAASLRESMGTHIHGRSDEVEPGIWNVVLTATPGASGDPGAGFPADVALIAESRFELPETDLAPNADLVFVSERDDLDPWSALSARWRRTIRRRDLRLYSAADLDELVALGAALASGGTIDREPIDWRDRPDTDAESTGEELPLAVRRLGESNRGPASVARFWGEYAQPRIEAPRGTPQIEPDLALGTMPAFTAGFHERKAGAGELPRIDPDYCTACGKCWVSCPDTAIAAVALGSQELLDAASELASSSSGDVDAAVAGKLKRAHRQLAARWAGALVRSESGAVDVDGLDDAFTWLVDSMKVAENDRPAFEQAFAGTREWIAHLPWGHSAPLFHDPESEQKGQGALHMLALDSRSCQSCGICAAVCDDDAIRLEPATPERRIEAKEAWDAWERLPDTPGKSIARASEDSRIGPLAALLLSRHCLLSIAGADAAEPGSGERIAARQVVGVVEYRMQRRRLTQVKNLESLVEKLRERITQSISQGVSLEDLGSLDRALDAAPVSRAPLGPVMERLDQLGQRTEVDVPAVRRLVRATQRLERTIESITHGRNGAGRARFGLVVSGRYVSAWAATFPWNPFGVPVALDQDGAAAALARGLAQGLLDQAVDEARLARLAELLLEAPSDLPARERDLERLTWRDLNQDERRACPPILLLAEPGLDGLDGLLASDLPVKTVLLDPCDLRRGDRDPLLPAIARGRAIVAATSIAHPAHLFDATSAALDFGGPALIGIHAPSPARHGFATDRTVERARLAVESRVYPLVRFAPPEEGGLGRGLDLGGNADLDDAWAEDETGASLTPTTWAADETRYSGSAPVGDLVDERARNWATLQELAGVAAPFAGKLEERIRGELAAAHETELAALRDEYETKLRDEEARQSRTQAAKLKERLMQLAGLRGGAAAPTRTEEDS